MLKLFLNECNEWSKDKFFVHLLHQVKQFDMIIINFRCKTALLSNKVSADTEFKDVFYDVKSSLFVAMNSS